MLLKLKKQITLALSAILITGGTLVGTATPVEAQAHYASWGGYCPSYTVTSYAGYALLKAHPSMNAKTFRQRAWNGEVVDAVANEWGASIVSGGWALVRRRHNGFRYWVHRSVLTCGGSGFAVSGYVPSQTSTVATSGYQKLDRVLEKYIADIAKAAHTNSTLRNYSVSNGVISMNFTGNLAGGSFSTVLKAEIDSNNSVNLSVVSTTNQWFQPFEGLANTMNLGGIALYAVLKKYEDKPNHLIGKAAKKLGQSSLLTHQDALEITSGALTAWYLYESF